MFQKPPQNHILNVNCKAKTMKYKLTPINLTCGVLIGLSIYGAIFSGPFGFGFLGIFYLLPIGLLGLGVDYLGQRTIKKYLNLFLIEFVILGILTFGYIRTERTKTFIIPDQRNFEFVVTIYGVEQADELPVSFLTWKYEKEIPENGIILTSTELNLDLPQTEMFTTSGLDLQNRNDTVDICFGRVSTSRIIIDSKSYDYQAWKIDKGGTIVYSSNDIEKLEEEIKDYLKKKKPSS